MNDKKVMGYWIILMVIVVSNAQRDIPVVGKVILPHTVVNIPKDSCLVMSIRKAIRCFLCSNPVIGQEVIIRNPKPDSNNEISYELTLPDGTESDLYTIGATLNIGWCKQGKEWIRKGDMRQKYSNEFSFLKGIHQKVVGPKIIMMVHGRLRPIPEVKVCEFDGGKYKPKDKFVTKDCNQKCECHKDGFISCLKYCDREPQSCPPGSNEVINTEIDPKTRCTCNRRTCEAPSVVSGPTVAEVCIAPDGVSVSLGTQHITKDCTKRCRCYASDDIRCVSLCPPVFVQCAPGEKLESYDQKVTDTDCFCTRKKCVQGAKKTSCFYLDNKYEVGKQVVNENCENCTCQENGKMNCVSICPKVNSIECQPYEMKVDYEENVAGTNCTCQKIECLDDLFGPTECQLDGKTFAPGEKFIPDCSRSCECMAGGSISCVSLCPQDVIECPPYEVEEFFDEKVSERCYCRKIRCKPASNQVRDILKGSLERKTKEVSSPNQCKFDGKFYKIGKSFIPDNCQGRCKCDKDGGVQCVSICPQEIVTCMEGGSKETYDTLVDGKCSCKMQRCKQVGSANQCEFNGRFYEIGESFIPDNCQGRCKCDKDGGVHCVSICPQEIITCADGASRETYDTLVDGKCSCKMQRCKQANSNTKCKFNEKFYEIGESFIPDNCQGRCKCDKDGGVHCVSICPQETITCADGASKETYDTLVDGKCSCKMQRCKQANSNTKCEFNGRFYEIGESFIPDNCQGRCTCDKDGGVHCVSICPQETITCADGASKETYDTLVDGKCSCKMQRCKQANSNTKCEFNGRFYEIGESFIPDNCQGRCTCDKDGGVHCVSICPQETITCADGASKETYDTLVDGKCSCKMQRCKQANSNTKCEFNGRFYEIGESFIPDNCQGRCTCDKDGGVHCVSICPQETITCADGASKETYDTLVDGKCSCKMQRCKQANSNTKCEFNGRFYEIGESFIPDNCQGRCKCDKDGGVHCVSICPQETITCGDGASKETYDTLVDGKCSCKMQRCKQANSNTKCEFNERFYEIGESFISDNCQGRCKCDKDGGVHCVSIRPQEIITCADGASKETYDTLVDGKCSCKMQRCKQANSNTKCEFNGRFYEIGESFIPDNCQGRCKCNKDGGVHCVSICPQQIITCADGASKETYDTLVDGKCSCKMQRCKQANSNTKCEFNGRFYEIGESFIPDNCQGRCKCNKDGGVHCVSICPQETITCADGASKETYDTLVDGKCSCKMQRCKQANSNTKCNFNGRFYEIGESFIPDNCQGQCKCDKDGGVHCVSICPQETITCADGASKETYDTLVDGKCSCKMQRCKQANSNTKCEFNGRFYEIGESFIPDNCQGRCSCDKDGGVHCVSICPQETITCADGASKETYDTLVAGKCSCKMQRCKQANSNTKCEFNGRFYEIGESFIPDNCQGRCKCDKDGGVHCVSICPQETITCADGASRETYDTLVDGKCSCKMQRCKQEIALHPSVSTCKHKDKFYIIGEWFVTDDCTGKCMCNENEEVHCVSPCPQENVICPLGSEIVIYDESIGGNCFCKKQKCLPISRECTYNGRTYPFGERFVPDDCSGYCECNPYGGFGCVSLCPPQIVVCQRGFIKQTYKNYITDKCFCERERCKPVALFPPVKFCYQNGKKYNFGEEIIESNCKARCVCQQNGVLDCFPLCDSPIVECRPGEHYNQIEEKIPGSDCKCPKTICLKGVNVPDKCIYKNKAYPFGDRFIPDDCLGYCKCNIFGGIDCISLCPPEILECREGFVKQMYQQKVSENCYCDRERCKSVTLPLHEKFCYQDGKKYKFGEEIIEGNCKARCVCQQNGVLDCFPLCDSPIVECRPGEHYKQIEENIPGSHCKCPKTICLKGVPEKCIYKNKAYPYGDRFVPDDCRGFCKCNPFGGIDCVSLCPPEIIECLPGFVKQTYKQKISDKCSCERELCTPEHNLNEVKLQDPQGDGETTHSKQCHRNCACLYAPVCGSDDKTYNNLCLFENAQCLDDTLTLKSGEKCEIKVEEKTNVCPENVKTFNCYKNPCDTSKCNGFPNARCRLNNCGGCKPQFFIGRMKVECKIEECPEGVPLVACSTDPCIGHSCPAYPNAKCVLNNCGGCNAEFYLTSRKVDCSMPKCQREREKLLQTNSGKILFGQYMPQCNSLGLYELMQCHEASCWCVDEKTGTKLNEKSLSIDAKECLRLFKQHKDSPETAEVKKEELKSYRIVGYVIYKPPIEKVHDNSCLFVEVRKSQHPEVLAKRKIMNPTELRISDGKMRYGIDLIDVASGEFHISATLNHGWCQDTNNKNKPSFRDGDYYTTFAELLSIRPDSDRKTHRKDITLHRVNVSETVDLSVVKVSGHVVINSDEEVSLKENSCLSIKVIDTIQCDYGLPCYPKVFGHKLYYDFQLKDNKIPYTIEIKKGNRHSYKISAVLNDGWCVNKGKWIQKGDYLSDTAHYIHRKDSDVIIYKDIEIKRYGVAVQKDDVTKKSVIVSGNVQLPTDIKTPLPKESCLHIYIQEAIYCLYCENPILAQIRITEPSITNRNIPYSIKLNLKKAKLGNFLVQSTLNIGWCGNENEWIRYNDFHNAFINEINVKEDTDKVDKDLMLERYQSKKPLFTEEADSVSVTGDVVLPYGAPISFSENSCLNMFIQEDIQCDEYCENPILTRFQLKNPQILDRRISYKLTLKKPTSGSYTIHATLNNDWCKTSQEWIRHGDYFNDIAHTFTLMENQLSHEMDVDVVLYEKKDSVVQTIPTNSPLAKPTLSGHVNIKDFQENIPKESCLQLFIQENIQCLFCHNPILSNLTIKNPKVENGKIAYKMDLPKLDEDSYTVHVMLRNGYCEDIRKPVKFDDFINNYSFTFDVRQDVAENKLNIDIEQYKQDSATEKQTSKKKYLEGKIKFSKNVDLPEGSCLKLKVQRDIQCDQPHCENPFLIKYTTKNIKINEQQIPFKVDITDLKEDLYIVEATVNQGYCGDIQAPARHGDFFNEYSVNFELKKDEHVVTTDIDVKQFVKQGCKKEEKIYEVNEIYHDNCNSCICGSDGLFRCTIMACSTGVCYHEGKEYKNDESYSKGCIDCSCRVVSPFAVGRFYCTKKFCVSDNEGAV